METMKFKTNAKCQGCVSAIGQKVAPIVGEGNWSIDLSSPEKTLTVTTDKTEEEIRAAVVSAGFKAEEV